ncbi:MAG: hypothetical protein JNL94_12640 [Planctomycetes bacterium]|nr:hypothetical protein [Planctomycetota bacterium]
MNSSKRRRAVWPTGVVLAFVCSAAGFVFAQRPASDPAAAAAQPEPIVDVTRFVVCGVARTFDDMASSADAIALGQVVSQRCVEWTDGLPCTEVTVRITESLVGEVAGTVRVLVGGGRIGGRVCIVDGAPSFVDGEEVVLFLDAGTEAGTYGIVGLADGTLRVDRSRGVPIVSGPRALTDEGLDAFTMRVQRAAGGAR